MYAYFNGIVKDIESKLDYMDSYIKESYGKKYNGKYARVLKR